MASSPVLRELNTLSPESSSAPLVTLEPLAVLAAVVPSCPMLPSGGGLQALSVPTVAVTDPQSAFRLPT